jgi:hypothetical protein
MTTLEGSKLCIETSVDDGRVYVKVTRDELLIVETLLLVGEPLTGDYHMTADETIRVNRHIIAGSENVAS